MLTSKKKFSIVTSVIAEGKNEQVSNRVTARAKVWVCGRLIAVIAGFESRRVYGRLYLPAAVCCHVEFFVSG